MLLLDDAMESHDIRVVGKLSMEADLLSLESVPSCPLLCPDNALDRVFYGGIWRRGSVVCKEDDAVRARAKGSRES